MAGLSERVIRGGAWMGGVRLAARLIATVRLVILARLLTPQDFGVFGVALLVTTLFETLSTAGTQLALIQRRVPAGRQLDTAWTLGLLRAGLLTIVLAALAPAIGAFFASPDAVAMVRAMAIVPFLGRLANIGMIEFRQELSFGPDALLALVSVVTELAVSLGLALWLGSAWALVGGALAAEVARVLASYVRHPYRPRLHLDLAEVRQLLRYGRWVVGSESIGRLLRSGIPAAVGRLLDVEAVGVFQMAWRVAVLPMIQVAQVLSAVTIGAYAKLQDSPDRLRRAYLRVLSAVALLTVPLSVGAAVYGDILVRLVLGPRWEAMVPLLGLLVLQGAARAVALTVEPLLYGVGHPRAVAVLAILELVVVGTALGPLTLWLGLRGAAVAVAAGAAASAAGSLWAVTRLLRIPVSALASVLGLPVLACAPFLLLRGWMPEMPPSLLALAAPLVAAGLFYLLAIRWLARIGLYSLDTTVWTSRWWRSSRG
jgi:O-antigen/teichoic acid export membrane protein